MDINLIEVICKLMLCLLFTSVLLKGCVMIAEIDRILGSLITVTLALGWAELMSSY
jgi:hypothetical protein